MTRYQTLILLQVCAWALDVACSGHVLKPQRRKNAVKARVHMRGVLCAKLSMGSLFLRAFPAFTPAGPCKAWSIAVSNEFSLYWYKLLRSDRQRQQEFLEVDKPPWGCIGDNGKRKTSRGCSGSRQIDSCTLVGVDRQGKVKLFSFTVFNWCSISFNSSVFSATSSVNLRYDSISPSIFIPFSSSLEILNTSWIVAVNDLVEIWSPCLMLLSIGISSETWVSIIMYFCSGTCVGIF